MVALFTFVYDGVKRADYNPNDWFDNPSIRLYHQEFNKAFVSVFPKLLYTAPFTNYTDKYYPIVTEARLTGTGETNWSEAQVRAAIPAMIEAVGLTGGTLELSYKTLEQIQAGQHLDIQQDNSNVNPLFTKDGATKAKTDFTFYFALAVLGIILIPRFLRR